MKEIANKKLSNKPKTDGDLPDNILQELPKTVPRDTKVLELEVRQALCDAISLRVIGAMHCYLLAYCEGDRVVKLDRGGSNEHFHNTLLEMKEVKKSEKEMRERKETII